MAMVRVSKFILVPCNWAQTTGLTEHLRKMVSLIVKLQVVMEIQALEVRGIGGKTSKTIQI